LSDEFGKAIKKILDEDKETDVNAETETQITFEQELTTRYHFKSMKDTQELYYYDDTSGIYVKGGEWLVEQECVRSNPKIKTKDVTDIKNRIIWANYTDRSAFDPDIEWLCCKNVMVNLRTLETKPLGPECMATVQIPHMYLYNTPCVPAPSKIMRFFYQVMAPEDVETVLDYLAYCLWRGFPFHRWLLFNGSGRNGKGVTTYLITRFLGQKNVSSETLHRLLDRTFAAAKLFGKMANIDADLSSDALKDTGLLKKLTGGDRIPAEDKFKPLFDFDNYAKLIFSANKIPKTPDESDAFYVRLIIINFPNQFLGSKDNSHLKDELTSESEMSGLLSHVLRRLPLVLERGITTPHSTIDENYIKYTESSDPIRLFVETSIDRISQEAKESYEPKVDLYEAYGRFCAEKRLGKESSETFSRRLKKEGLEYEPKKIDGTKIYVWKNIKLKDWTKVEEGQETL
jgi:putative DNA primase/helicase